MQQPNAPAEAAVAADKRIKLGFVPVAKIGSICGPKSWPDYEKRSQEMSAARDAKEKLRADITAAIAKKLNLGSPDSVEFSVSGDKLILYRRPEAKPKKAAKSTMADLTA